MKLRQRTILALTVPALIGLAACQRNEDTASRDIDRTMAEAGRPPAEAPGTVPPTAAVPPATAPAPGAMPSETTPPPTADSGRTAGEVLSDAAITAAVKAELMKEPTLSALAINVDTTDNGAVTLKGEVETPAAKERAEQLARNTRGVREVTNLLVVKSA
ncbi:MAG: BON domain-containing protein [Burkholderiaceae bacterium]